MKARALLIFSLGIWLLTACTSGKTALKKGDYYEAVIESVNRLRSSPDNKKAKVVLEQGYPLAIQYIEGNIQNGITADDPQKWRNAVKGYEQINYLGEQIRTSPGALRVIPNPTMKFKELGEAKAKAADESYVAGINAMMKNTREDAKEAYYSFKMANDYQPGYKESIEMMTQAEFVATIRVEYEDINASRYNYGGIEPIVNSLRRQFLSFRPVGKPDTVPPHQKLRMVFNGYFQDFRTNLTSNSEEVSRDVKVGEKKGADGKTQDVMQKVTAKVTYYRRTKQAYAQAQVTITEVASSGQLKNDQVRGNALWQNEWATYTGDVRALSSNQQTLIKRTDVNPNDDNLYNQAIQDLQNKLSQDLRSFYSQY